MKRLISAAVILLLSTAVIFAQTDDGTTQEEEDNIEFVYTKNYAGDQFIRIALGPSFPMNFPDLITSLKGNGQLYAGGMGSLGYHYFLTSLISVGGEIGFGFNLTKGSNTLNYIPVLMEATLHPTIHNFEFPITLGIGLGWETYSKYTYFPAPMFNPQVGVHYRINSSWSLGMDFGYLYMPEWTSNGYSAAHMITACVAAKYYF